MTITREITFNVVHDTHNEVPPAIIKKSSNKMYEKILHTFPLCEKMSLRLGITNSTSGKMKELGFIIWRRNWTYIYSV